MKTVGSVNLAETVRLYGERIAALSDGAEADAETSELLRSIWMQLAEMYDAEARLWGFVGEKQLERMCNGEPFRCIGVGDGAGKSYLVVGCGPDDDKHPEYLPQDATAVSFAVHTIFDMVCRDEAYAGLVLNPWGGEAVVLQREMIMSLLQDG